MKPIPLRTLARTCRLNGGPLGLLVCVALSLSLGGCRTTHPANGGAVPLPDLAPWFASTACEFASNVEIESPEVAEVLGRFCDDAPPPTVTEGVIQAIRVPTDQDPYIWHCPFVGSRSCDLLLNVCQGPNRFSQCHSGGEFGCYCVMFPEPDFF